MTPLKPGNMEDVKQVKWQEMGWFQTFHSLILAFKSRCLGAISIQRNHISFQLLNCFFLSHFHLFAQSNYIYLSLRGWWEEDGITDSLRPEELL